jgi:hypothetical protein
LNNEIFNTTTTALNEEKRRKIIVDFISEHQGCNAEYVKNGVKDYIGSVKVFRILKDLKEENIVIGKKIKPNSREIQLYINNDNLLVSITRELEEFEKAFFKLLEKAELEFEEKYVAIPSQTRNLSIQDQLEYSKMFFLIIYPLQIFDEMVNVYNFYSILLWPKKIQDKDTLKELYTVVLTKIANMRVRIVEILRPLASGLVDALMNSKFLDSLYATRNMMDYHRAFSEFGMQKEIEPVLDSMWKINSEYKQNAYPEPMLYGWDFGATDDWRKLIELQKQHPDETYLLNDDSNSNKNV